jgi:hypothetical protein
MCNVLVKADDDPQHLLCTTYFHPVIVRPFSDDNNKLDSLAAASEHVRN